MKAITSCILFSIFISAVLCFPHPEDEDINELSFLGHNEELDEGLEDLDVNHAARFRRDLAFLQINDEEDELDEEVDDIDRLKREADPKSKENKSGGKGKGKGKDKKKEKGDNKGRGKKSSSSTPNPLSSTMRAY